MNARFLLSQFEVLDGASGHKALKFLETDFGKALAKEVGGVGLVDGQGEGGRELQVESVHIRA